jgi:hypothetical protein
VQTRSALKAPLDALYRADNEWGNHPNWKALDKKCRTLPVKDALDPAKVAALKAEVDAFLVSWPGPMFATWKRLRAAPVTLVAAPAPTKRWWQFWK